MTMSDSISGLNSLYTNGTYASSANSTANSIQDTLSNTDLTSASDEKLLSVCKNFEEYFVEQVVKSMVKMANVNGDSDSDNNYASLFGLSSGDDSSIDTGMSTMASFYGDKMVSIMSDALCKSKGGQGIGLAQTLYKQMKRNYGGIETASTATATTAANTTTAATVTKASDSSTTVTGTADTTKGSSATV
jgi:flagellar protein FlgJ